jgi:cytochrome c oxidase subunit 2
MTTYLIIGIVVLLISIIFQVSKTSEMVAILKGNEAVKRDSNDVIAKLFIGFMFIFFTGIVWSSWYYAKDFLPETSSEHGVWIDSAFNITLVVTGIVFVVTQILLFVFTYIYRDRKDRVAYFYPDNHKIEMLWTVVPAIFMTGLVVSGLYYWYKITDPASPNAMVIEVTGKQFNWIARYPGADGKLGAKAYTLINDNNILGLDWNDNAGKDDVMPTELVLVKGQETKIIIGSRDVMHNFDLVHFNVKMDAVPGIPTTFKLVPRFTSKEMKKRLNNPKFEYELACAQICGQSHYAMKMAVRVIEKAEFDKWIKEQKPYYASMVATEAPLALKVNAAQEMDSLVEKSKSITENNSKKTNHKAKGK